MAIDINGIKNAGLKNAQVSPLKERNGQAKVTDEAPNTSAKNTGVGSLAGGSDTVHFTESAKKLQRLTQSVEDIPVVDQQRVSDIRSSLHNGDYPVHPQSIASKLLQFESLLPSS